MTKPSDADRPPSQSYGATSSPQRIRPVADMEKIVSLCKRRGFIFQSSEIYGGLNGCWDYGPLGVELKRRLYTFKGENSVVAAVSAAFPKLRRRACRYSIFRNPTLCLRLDCNLGLHRTRDKALLVRGMIDFLELFHRRLLVTGELCFLPENNARDR